MFIIKEKVWKYKSNNGKSIIIIYEIENGILCIIPEGIACREGCDKAFDFLINYAHKTGGKVRCLIDNTKCKMIDNNSKLLFLRFQEINKNTKKIAVIGSNVLIKKFGQIYKHVFKSLFKVNNFYKHKVAIEWLKINK